MEASECFNGSLPVIRKEGISQIECYRKLFSTIAIVGGQLITLISQICLNYRSRKLVKQSYHLLF